MNWFANRKMKIFMELEIGSSIVFVCYFDSEDFELKFSL